MRLYALLGSSVVDKTGLAGKYDFEMHWSPDEQLDGGMFPPGAASRDDKPNPPQADPGPSLFTAIQEQLGLKLEAQKEPVDVVVIDHIQQPSPN